MELEAPKIIYLANNAKYFLSHRLPVAREAFRRGMDVHVAAPSDPEAEEGIRKHGFKFHSLEMTRRKAGLGEIQTVFQIFRLFRAIRPALVHAVTIKPVIYGGIAGRLAGVPSRVSTISGLGHVFEAKGIWASLRRLLVCLAYRVALGGKGSEVIFQNDDNRWEFLRKRIVNKEQTHLIRGSGVDLRSFPYTPESSTDTPMVVLAARMLATKGVREFIEAARKLRQNGTKARFVLVGGPDPGNPATILERELEQWAREGVVEWWGERGDMAYVLAQSSIVCLPSYGEGVPKVLLEAGAIGRPLIATDVPGCREVVLDGLNGFLVKREDTESLVTALERLLNDSEARRRLGEASFRMVSEKFSDAYVVQSTSEVYFGGVNLQKTAGDLSA